jgi:hypothetical protein
MSNRGQSFVVEVKRKRNADYSSKPGDSRRSGRVEVAAEIGLMPVHVDFYDGSAAIEARLGVITVGAVTHDVTSKGYFWAVYLPGFSAVPRPAKDAEAARRAILHKVREWCEAAKVISGRRK